MGDVELRVPNLTPTRDPGARRWRHHINADAAAELGVVRKLQDYTALAYNHTVTTPAFKMSTMFADTILIVFISICTALLAEGK